MPGGQHALELTSPDEIKLWEQLCKHSGETFTTSGRRNRAGVEFKYEIKGAEMFVSNRSKSITRATILYAFHKVQEMNGEVKGPKAIGVHGDSYIYAVFKALGVINGSNQNNLTSPGHSLTPEEGNKVKAGARHLLDSRGMISIPGIIEETELKSMPRPKGSKNKKAISTELVETVESIDERIAAAEAAIETLTTDLKAKKAELKELVKLKAQAEAVAAKKKAEEDKAAILEAVEKSGKTVEEILELLK